MLHPPALATLVTHVFSTLLIQWDVPLLSLGALFVLVIAVKILLQVAENKRLARSGIRDIDRMGGRTFERYLAVIFRHHGYHVQLTPASKDQGADLVLTKGGERTVVQAKRWKQKVGNKTVQEVVAAKAPYQAQHAMIVTNSFFTREARALAKANHVALWDRDQLTAQLVDTDALHQVAPTTAVGTAQSDPRSCPLCGAPLIVRQRKRDSSSFWGCTSFPKRHYTSDRKVHE